jgi:hypothetical protein
MKRLVNGSGFKLAIKAAREMVSALAIRAVVTGTVHGGRHAQQPVEPTPWFERDNYHDRGTIYLHPADTVRPVHGAEVVAAFGKEPPVAPTPSFASQRQPPFPPLPVRAATAAASGYDDSYSES